MPRVRSVCIPSFLGAAPVSFVVRQRPNTMSLFHKIARRFRGPNCQLLPERRSSCRKWQMSSFTQLPRPILAAELLVAVAAAWTAVTPAAEWVRLTPLGQWNQEPSADTGSPDVSVVQVGGGYAYLADANYGLHLIDVSNPTNLQWVGGYATGGIARDLATRDSLVYVAALGAGLAVVDVSNPTDPRRVGGYAVSAQGIALQGTYAYLACGSNGVHVLDISDPTSPRRVGSCAVPGEASRIAVSDDYA